MAAQEELDGEDTMLKFFGSELVRLRNKRGVGQKELAQATHSSQALVSKIETADRVPSRDFTRDADSFLDTGGHLARLWPLVIKYAYPSWFRPFVELEKQATIIRSYETMIVPGLLQTRAYARAILSESRSPNLETLLDVRMERQALLERETPPELWVILEEAALRRVIGGADVMAEQLQRIIDAAEQPATVVQVIQSESGCHAGIEGPFATLAFEKGNPVVYVDGFIQGQLLADPGHLKTANRTYDLLLGAALPVRKSVDLIARIMKELPK
ncbi:helix-turn-helix transcriptional regulator [Streptomyces sp. NPDC007084]|uniref:helix-turn-helix domain-containing protein n=1 Tax=Streptomyces sp. NPDC007084 TaxID=3154313 RepID=UPI0034534FFB